MSKSKFFTVHSRGNLSTKQECGICFGLDTAIPTAQNLAKLNPGTTYYVMEAIEAFTAELPVIHHEVV